MQTPHTPALEHFFIYGASSFAIQVWEIICSRENCPLRGIMRGFIGKTRNHENTLLGYPVYPYHDEMLECARTKGPTACVIGFGAQHLRIPLWKKIRESGVIFPTVIHKSAVVSSFATIADGVVVSALANIGPGANIGFGAIVNDNSVVSHDCVLEDYAQLAPGVSLAGYCQLKEGSFIGIGATLLPDCVIGRRALIGAGAVVAGEIPNGAKAYGVPARIHGESGLLDLQ